MYESIGAVRYEISGMLSKINKELRECLKHKPIQPEKIEDIIEKIRDMIVDI